MAAVNLRPACGDEQIGRGAKPGPGRRLAMWTRTVLLLVLLAVVLPLTLLLGIQLGTAWVEQVVLP